MIDKLVNITTRDVADMARVDTSTVRRWVHPGTLKPSMKLPGGHYRFDKADVDALLNPQPAPAGSTFPDVELAGVSSSLDAA